MFEGKFNRQVTLTRENNNVVDSGEGGKVVKDSHQESQIEPCTLRLYQRCKRQDRKQRNDCKPSEEVTNSQAEKWIV